MRIRSGFVSNSSSSSFIAGIGIIKNMAKFAGWLAQNNVKLTKHDIDIVPTSDIVSESWMYEFVHSPNRLEITTPVNYSERISIPIDLSKEEYFFVVRIANNEGDQCFRMGPDCVPDYNIDKNWFDEPQQAIIDAFEDAKMFKKSKYKFGAGRNG